MAFFGNFEGTLRSVISLAKGSNKVGIRSNAGILQGQDNGGAWTNLIGGGGGETVEVKSVSFSAATSKIYISTAAGLIFAFLPVPVLNAKITFKRYGTGLFGLAPNATELIDGQASYTLSSEKQSVTIVSDGTDWFII